MIVLHGTWNPPETIKNRGYFFLWGETSSYSPIKRKGHPPKIGTHPFQINENTLYKVIESLGLENSKNCSKKICPDNVTYLLPSYSKSPQACPKLFLEDNIKNLEELVKLSPWKVNGLNITHDNAILLLSTLSEVMKKIQGIIIGTDLKFWSNVSKFIIELLAKQQFIPSIVIPENIESEIIAQWEHILDRSEDRIRFSMLVKSIPPVCMSILQDNKIPNSPEVFLLDYINAVINECIQNWISLSQIRMRKSTFSKAWLESLIIGEPIMGYTSKRKNLSKAVLLWKGQIYNKEKSTFKTCFRLEPPALGDDIKSDHWTLQYFLQASDDPSLLVPAEKVWKESKDTLQFLNRKFDYPQEKLLIDLGKASRLYPPIETSLLSAKPVDAHLTNQDAYKFLKEVGLLLQESGFGILVPPFWNKNTTQKTLGVKLSLKPKRTAKTSKGILNFSSIIEYDWKIALGRKIIDKEELEKLASLKEPLVRIRGQWVELKQDHIEKTLKFFKSRNSGEMKLSEALKLTIGHEDLEQGLSINEFHTSGWLNELFKQLSGKAKIKELQQPHGFIGELRPYQINGFSWLFFLRQYGLGACLADDMGLGKTIQLLALLLKDKIIGVKKPTLLICPTSIIGNWKRESFRFAPSLKVLVHHGINRKNEKEFLSEAAEYDFIITTYGLAHRDENIITQIEWNSVVLDEAQNIKNYFTKQSQSIRKLRADYRVALTGTPIENRLSELWSIMDFLNPNYLGSASEFHKKFALPIERFNDKDAGIRLKNLVQPFILRRLKSDPTVIKDLPEKIEMKTYCNLSKEQATLYKAVVKDMLRKIEDDSGIKRKGLILSALIKLKQICNHPAHFLNDGSEVQDRSGKVKRIIEILEEILAEGHNALIFTQFAKMGGILKNYLQNVFNQEVLFLHGGVSQKFRDKMILRFSEKNGPKLFILSLKAGGLGLNLTRANHVIHFDRWWNPAVENQATDRAFRIGQTKNVMVHKFICEGTLEEKIDEMIESKKILAESIIAKGEGWLTEMTTEKLREVFTLRQVAVYSE